MRCWREDGDTMKGSVLYHVLHIILVVIAVLFSILLMYVIIVWGHPDTGISEEAVPILQEAHEVYSEKEQRITALKIGNDWFDVPAYVSFTDSTREQIPEDIALGDTVAYSFTQDDKSFYYYAEIAGLAPSDWVALVSDENAVVGIYKGRFVTKVPEWIDAARNHQNAG